MGQSDPPSDAFNMRYFLRYVANVGIWLLFVLSMISDFLLTQQQVTGAWLGLGETQWHWATFILGAAAFVYNGLTHAPPLNAPPTQKNMNVEQQVHEIRKAA